MHCTGSDCHDNCNNASVGDCSGASDSDNDSNSDSDGDGGDNAEDTTLPGMHAHYVITRIV
jgi:hypothetical protein